MVEPAFDVMDVGRMAVIADPQGAHFSLWEPKTHIGSQISDEPGAMCWNELSTSDTDAAGAFYSGLFGWSHESSEMGPMIYTTFKNGDRMAAGMLEINPEWGEVPPHWSIYLTVSDCDASVAKVGELGGKVIEPARDIPEVGRFAMAADPQGAAFALIQLENPE